MSDDIITINNLTKNYSNKRRGGNNVAVDDLNLSIKEGSFFSLLGPNGAGKSTTINILSSIIKKTSGIITIDGHDLDKDSRKCKYKIGTSMQELYLDPFLNVDEYLNYTAGYFGLNHREPETKKHIKDIVQHLQLEPFLKKSTRILSGGMKRRLSIAKSLIHKPKILILDEPTAGVDIEIRQSLWAYIRSLNQSGVTIILTTHYLEEAQELSDQIAFINKGKIILNDKTENILSLIDKTIIFIKVKNHNTARELNLRQIEESIEHEIVESKEDASQANIKITYRKSTNPMLLINAVTSAGYEILSFHTQDSKLEDIFLYLINKNR